MTDIYVAHTFASGKTGSFRIFPATIADDLIDDCPDGEPDGWAVDLLVRCVSTGEVVLFGVGYDTEDTPLFADPSQARDFILDGSAEQLALRTAYGDNIDQYEPAIHEDHP